MAQSKQLPGIFKRRAWPWPVVLPVLRWVSGSPGKGEGLRNDGLRPGASPGAAVRTRCSAPPPAVQAGPLPPSPPGALSCWDTCDLVPQPGVTTQIPKRQPSAGGREKPGTTGGARGPLLRTQPGRAPRRRVPPGSRCGFGEQQSRPSCPQPAPPRGFLLSCHPGPGLSPVISHLNCSHTQALAPTCGPFPPNRTAPALCAQKSPGARSSRGRRGLGSDGWFPGVGENAPRFSPGRRGGGVRPGVGTATGRGTQQINAHTCPPSCWIGSCLHPQHPSPGPRTGRKHRGLSVLIQGDSKCRQSCHSQNFLVEPHEHAEHAVSGLSWSSRPAGAEQGM